MSRKPKEPNLVNAIQISLQRNAFLGAVQETCPQMFGLLRSMVEDCRAKLRTTLEASDFWQPGDERYFGTDLLSQMTDPLVRSWALRFGVEESWIESKGREFALFWLTHDQPSRDVKESLPQVVVGNPLDDKFRQCVVTIPIPYEFRMERANFSWPTLRKYLESQIQPAFEQALREIEQDGIASGILNLQKTPLDLRHGKYPVTALYLFQRLSPEQIGLRPGYARDRTVLNRWIKETTKLLDLESVRKKRLSVNKANVFKKSSIDKRRVAQKSKGK